MRLKNGPWEFEHVCVDELFPKSTCPHSLPPTRKLWQSNVFTLVCGSVQWGVCPGRSLSRGVSVRETPLYSNVPAVCILLECILVSTCLWTSANEIPVIRSSNYDTRLVMDWPTKQEESIPVGCIPPPWKPYVLKFQLPRPDVIGGRGRSPNEHVRTGLQWSPPDVTSRGRGW